MSDAAARRGDWAWWAHLRRGEVLQPMNHHAVPWEVANRWGPHTVARGGEPGNTRHHRPTRPRLTSGATRSTEKSVAALVGALFFNASEMGHLINRTARRKSRRAGQVVRDGCNCGR